MVRSQETDKESVATGVDAGQSSDERSGDWKSPSWNPAPWQQPFVDPFPPLQVSTDTLRQCSAQTWVPQNGDSECNNKPVLSAVGCTQALLRDGQLSIVNRLAQLQTALWRKLETLKEAVGGDTYVPDDSWKKDTLEDIKRSVDRLVRWKRNEDAFLKDFRKDVLAQTGMLKAGQRDINYKLYYLHKQLAYLSRRIYRCCGCKPRQCSKNQVTVGDRCLSCPKGFEERNDRCLSTIEAPFDEAKRRCEGDGAFLAAFSPETEESILKTEEQKFVCEFIFEESSFEESETADLM